MSNNRWIQHIREYAKENNISYACALGKASETYTKTTKDDKKNAEQLKITEGFRMHMKRMRKQYNEGKDDAYQLNILIMKFNRFNNIVKNYIQKNDPTLYDALSIDKNKHQQKQNQHINRNKTNTNGSKTNTDRHNTSTHRHPGLQAANPGERGFPWRQRLVGRSVARAPSLLRCHD